MTKSNNTPVEKSPQIQSELLKTLLVCAWDISAHFWRDVVAPSISEDIPFDPESVNDMGHLRLTHLNEAVLLTAPTGFFPPQGEADYIQALADNMFEQPWLGGLGLQFKKPTQFEEDWFFDIRTKLFVDEYFPDEHPDIRYFSALVLEFAETAHRLVPAEMSLFYPLRALPKVSIPNEMKNDFEGILPAFSDGLRFLQTMQKTPHALDVTPRVWLIESPERPPENNSLQPS
jgi:hypothetical protein